MLWIEVTIHFVLEIHGFVIYMTLAILTLVGIYN